MFDQSGVLLIKTGLIEKVKILNLRPQNSSDDAVGSLGLSPQTTGEVGLAALGQK